MRATTRMAASALIALVGAMAPGRADLAPGRAPEAAPRASGPQEADVVAVLVDPRTHVHTVVLQGKRDRRQLAMAIGQAEATGIAVPLHGVTPPRPLTRFLCGRKSPALTSAKLYDHRLFGRLEAAPFPEVLAWAEGFFG